MTLYHSFQGLSIYGKEPEALESIQFLFHITLAGFTWQQIDTAFRYYFKYFKGMPEPCDIVTIIERRGKPPFERSVYINICKKPPEERDAMEWEYKKDYENFIVSGRMD